MTVLLTVMCSLIALSPFAWVLITDRMDLKIQVESCKQACASEKLDILLHRAQVDLEDLQGGPGKSIALDELTSTLKDIRDQLTPKKNPEVKP